MIRKIINRNKKKFHEYNSLRKQMFAEFSPKDSEIILHMLPWLLSINHPDCPGYIMDIEAMFRVYGVNINSEIRKRESTFKGMLGIGQKQSLIKPFPKLCTIHGLYTIGSIGTVSQTVDSDCDIWVCYRRSELNDNQFRQMTKKITLIEEWIGRNCRLPVHFFISDVDDIQQCLFGSVDEESSGSSF